MENFGWDHCFLCKTADIWKDVQGLPRKLPNIKTHCRACRKFIITLEGIEHFETLSAEIRNEIKEKLQQYVTT